MRNRALTGLFSMEDRARLQQTVTRYSNAVRQTTEQRGAAVAASTQLVQVPLDSAEHPSAALRFHRSHRAATSAAGDVAKLKASAESAADQLAQDDAARKAGAGTLALGERAEEQLLSRVRSKIGDAVAAGGLLPVWFTTVFGPLPSRRGPAAWLDDASACVLYRMLYDVHDQVLLLGEEPEGEGWEQFEPGTAKAAPRPAGAEGKTRI